MLTIRRGEAITPIRGGLMPKVDRIAHWGILFIGLAFTVLGGTSSYLSYVTREGRPAPSWLSVFDSLDSAFFALLGQLLLYAAVFIGLLFLVAMGRTLRAEQG